MKTNQHTAEQIITVLDQAATREQSVVTVYREQGTAVAILVVTSYWGL